ncbi:hypothetical protein SDC9_137528 [bioreactor metagenome]|uniref:Uncharacterized protein n=1 Tax=bioreactor metagenome TaxID=1076179 RepID=A0A645DM89_9ZZZZ
MHYGHQLSNHIPVQKHPESEAEFNTKTAMAYQLILNNLYLNTVLSTPPLQISSCMAITLSTLLIGLNYSMRPESKAEVSIQPLTIYAPCCLM